MIVDPQLPFVPPTDGMDEPAPPAEEPMPEEDGVVCIDKRIAGNEIVTTKIVDASTSLFKKYESAPERKLSDEINRSSYMLYMGYKRANADDDAIVIREPFRQVETIKPQSSKYFFQDKRFTISARLEGNDAKAIGATEVMHDQIRRFGSGPQLQMWHDNSLLYGRGYLCPAFRRYKQTRYKMQAMHARLRETYWKRESSEVPLNAPYLENIPWWDVFSHPHTEEAKNSPAVFIRRGVSGDDLKTLVREEYLDAKATQIAVDANDGGGQIDFAMRDLIGMDNGDFEIEDDRSFELMICWTFNGWEYVIINGQYLVRAMPLEDGTIPIHTLRNYPQCGSHFGIPEPLLIMGEQKLVDKIMNIYPKAIAHDTFPMYTVLKTAKGTFQETKIAPGAAYFVNNHEEIKLIQKTGASSIQLANDIAFLQSKQKLASGATDELAGVGTSAKTATMGVRLQDSAGERMQHRNRYWAPVFEDVYRHMYNLNARHFQGNYFMRVIGADGAVEFNKYTPEVFKPEDVDVSVEIGNTSGSIEKARFLLDLYKVAGQDPAFNREPLLEEIVKAAELPHPKRFKASSNNSQGDALKEEAQWLNGGVIADPKATDNHQVHLQSHMNFRQTMEFGMLAAEAPDIAARFEQHCQIHDGYFQQMMAANEQMQQAAMQPPNQGETGIQPEANARTEALFQNAAQGQRGAA